jgi:hypothetical protein
MMTSCPKGVMFWHKKQVIELVEGDFGPSNIVSSWCKGIPISNMPSHNQIITTTIKPYPSNVMSSPRK